MTLPINIHSTVFTKRIYVCFKDQVTSQELLVQLAKGLVSSILLFNIIIWKETDLLGFCIRYLQVSSSF